MSFLVFIYLFTYPTCLLIYDRRSTACTAITFICTEIYIYL